MAEKSILVVDDDPKVRTLLRRCLEGEGFVICEAETEAGVMDALRTRQLDLITLDLNLGRESGLEVAQAVRRVSQVPIVMVTGKGDIIDRVVGLEIGADDYIAKPFHVREVVARIRSVLRRTGHPDKVNGAPQGVTVASNGGEYQFDGLVARPDRLELLDREGTPIELTSGDFKLLQVFLERPKRVLSREQIMDDLNGPGWSPLDRTIDNQVARLRKKIEKTPSNPKLIKTVRGVGYTLAAEVASS
jgi:DNA-binding response OmpR family regulator